MTEQTAARRPGRFAWTRDVALLAPIAGLLAMLPMLIRRVGTPDYFWHVRTGQWMLENHEIVRSELYTYTLPGTPWTAQEYGTELSFALLQRVGGLALVSVAYGVGYWIGFWALLARVRQRPFAPFIAGVGLLVGAAAGFPVWATRPEMWDVLFGSIVLYWLERFMAGRSRALWFLPLLVVVWANLHGGFIFGLFFVGACAVAQLIRWMLTRELSLLRSFADLVGIGVLGAIAGLITPWGPALYAYILKTEFSAVLPGFVAEYQSPDFHMLQMVPFGVMLLLVFGGFAWQRPRLHDLLMIIVTAALSMRSWYFIPLFVMTATPVLVWEWSEPWQRLRDRLSLRELDAPPRTAGIAVVAVIAVAAVGLTAYALRGQAASTRANYPQAAVDWLTAHPDVGTRMFNEYAWGGYIVDRLYPEQNRRVFIYGEGFQTTYRGDPLLADYADVNNLRPDWERVLDKWNVDYVLFPAKKPLDAALVATGRWTMVYSDAVADIFVRA